MKSFIKDRKLMLEALDLGAGALRQAWEEIDQLKSQIDHLEGELETLRRTEIRAEVKHFKRDEW